MLEFVKTVPRESAQTFLNSGFAIVRGLVSPMKIENLKGALRRLLQKKVRSEKEDLDELYALLNGPAAVMDLIRVTKDLPEYYELCLDKAVVESAKTLLDSSILQMVHDICLFRIDPQDDTSRSFDWHQDYQYNCMSLNALTAWIPLTPVTKEMGGVRIAPGTQGEIYVSSTNEGSQSGGKGHKYFELDNLDVGSLEENSLDCTNLEPGDVLFLSPLVLHRSSLNQSKRCRWVCNPRFGDALDPKLIERGWQTTRDKNPFYFKDIHPDKVK